ncbi:hypothetical protein [Azospirillum argentinense]|uniref:hypothetical protein n=1 Tax=Azospirillum argentinense TaxID=2970906 RepID=UPI0032E03B15
MPSITVSAPAGDRRLCSIEALRAELGIADDDTRFTPWLESECTAASDRVAEACGIAPDDDGDAPATLAAEVAVITFCAAEIPNSNMLELPWRYPARVTGITVGGQLLDPNLYRAQSKSGLVSRVDASGRPVCWSRAETAVTVQSGWSADAVPTVLQDAVKRLVRLRWEGRGRDLALKAKEVEGVGREEYWVGGSSAPNSAVPADVVSALQAAGLIVPVVI